MKRLLIAADVDRSLLTRAHADGRFEIVDRPVKSEDELEAIAGDCEILVTRSYNRVTRRVIEAARDRGIAVINMPGENANAVAELVIGFMIALTRTVPAYDRSMRDGIWDR